MKKITLFVTLVLVLLAAACKNGPQAQSNTETKLPAGYSLRDFNTSALLAAKAAKQKDRIKLVLSLLAVTGHEQEEHFINSILYSGKNPEQYRDMLIKSYQAAYQRNPSPAGIGWEHWETMNITGLESRGLIIRREKYVFTGGAHGMGTRVYVVIDRETAKILTLADFVREPNGPALRMQVKEELRRYSRLEKGRNLSEGIFFEDEPEMSFNFYINQEGLGLHWDPIEIAPYSEGAIEILLPWKTIRPLLKHEGMELLAKFGIHLFVS